MSEIFLEKAMVPFTFFTREKLREAKRLVNSHTVKETILPWDLVYKADKSKYLGEQLEEPVEEWEVFAYGDNFFYLKSLFFEQILRFNQWKTFEKKLGLSRDCWHEYQKLCF